MKTSHGLAIDGFMPAHNAGGASSLNRKTKITQEHLKSTAQGIHQRAQRSQTLMRSAVKKPQAAIAKTISLPAKVAHPRARTAPLDEFRTTRLQSIAKNAQVRRFGYISSSRASSKTQLVHTPQPAKTTTAITAANPSLVNKPLPSMITSVSHQKLERLLDEALVRADAHQKARGGHFYKRSLWHRIKFAPRWLTISISVFVLLIVSAYIAVHKVPQVAMRIAAARAHVNAHIPAYTPLGFSYAAPIKYGGGSVSMKFKATGNSPRSYTLTQQTSNMDSQSLQNTVMPSNSQVQTSQVEGTTVYIYGPGNNAVWVNHGVQYTISDSANLNSNQILQIAGSL